MAFIRSMLVFVTGYVLIIGVLVIAGFVLETIDDNTYCDTAAYCPNRSYLQMHKRLMEDGLLL